MRPTRKQTLLYFIRFLIKLKRFFYNMKMAQTHKRTFATQANAHTKRKHNVVSL